MAYEIDFISVKGTDCKKDADAICLRWKETDAYGNSIYKIGVVDGGFEAHGDAMVSHMNHYYFNDKYGLKSSNSKIIDFIVVTHPDLDHTSGLKTILDKFFVKKIYMNRPWLYIDELWPNVNDGRITKDSLKRRLLEKYKPIADIEATAKTKGIPILETFQGTVIERKLNVLSPTKEFYLKLLVESNKTPLQEDANCQRVIDALEKFYKTSREYLLSLFETWSNELLREDVETTPDNETSIVLLGTEDNNSFLLTGDAGIRALEIAMDYAESLGVDVRESVTCYQMPHHGSRHNVSTSILNRMIGGKVKEGTIGNKIAVASVAEGSDHPLKMVTNAYIRRGVKAYQTDGSTVCQHHGDMPERGWTKCTPIRFSELVEEWD